MMRALSLVLALPAAAAADTVYLKNGEWIDGKVSLKTNAFIELQIGDIGKIDLPLEEIHSIEKNNRTGGKSVGSYVEPKGRTEKVGPVKSSAKAPAKEEPARDSSASTKAASVEKAAPGAERGSGKPDGEDEAKAEPPVKDDLDPELKARIEELVREIQRDKARNRVQAERHLEAIGQPSIPFLIPVAKNQNDLTRIAIMRLFHSFGDWQVVETAIEGLLDDNEYVREYANKALKRITGEDFGYQPSASPRRREVAQRKWTDWWETEQKSLEEERKLSEKAAR